MIVFIKLIYVYCYDFIKYIKHSSIISSKSVYKKLYKITFIAHGIEKGLSLKDVRPSFGYEKIVMLRKLLYSVCKDLNNCERWEIENAIGIIDAYVSFHQEKKYIISDINLCELNKINELCKRYNIKHFKAGVKKIFLEEYSKISFNAFSDICECRRSIRDFSGEEVLLSDIVDSIKLAQKAPSVCNRQTVYTYIVTDRNTLKSILNIQGGSKGFDINIDKLLIICCDNNAFMFPGERNSAYFDAGLFSMNLINALTCKKIGTCVLQWWNNHKKEKSLRSIVDIDAKYIISCIIAVGGIKSESVVAMSNRKHIFDVYKIY